MVTHRLTETTAQTGGMTKGQLLSPGMLKTGALAASVAGCVFLASPAHQALAAPGPFLPHGIQGNPLPLPVGAPMFSRPAFVDIDADGDIDIFVGDKEGSIHYFENIGTASAPAFEMRTGADSPFWYYDTGCETYYPYTVDGDAAPAFADIDNDGDLDAFVGSGYGYGSVINYFENIGDTASTPEFTPYTGTDTFGNPFGIWAPPDPTPAFVDIDNDGDMDLFIGSGYGEINYFENIGSVSEAMFSASCGPLYFLTGDLDHSAPAFADIDGDGDLDAFVGSKYESTDVSYGLLGPIIWATGNVTYFENVGSASAPMFTSYNPDNPFNGVETDRYSAPAFADIDGDGDLDAFVGGKYGDLEFFENTGAVDSPALTKRHLKENPAWGADVGKYSKPTFVDIDGDGDLDAFVGELGTFAGFAPAISYPAFYGNVNFFENIGTAANPDFVQREGAGNPLDGALDFFEIYSAPAFVDIDGDGDMDAFISAMSGYGYGYGYASGLGEQAPPVAIRYFKNIGTATSPDLVAMPAENPLVNFPWFGDIVSPAFVDIDGDGDFDLFVGTEYGDIFYFENTGTASAPLFDILLPTVLEEQVQNPFGIGPFPAGANPAFADIDGDGDMDAVVGIKYGGMADVEYDSGILYYFENTTTATDTEPVFTQRTGEDNPFGYYGDEMSGLYCAAPAFADIDGDGDMDLFVGELYGRIGFLENRAIVPVPADDDDDDTPAILADDDDTCFINSAVGASNSGQTSLFSRITGQVYGAVRSMFRP